MRKRSIRVIKVTQFSVYKLFFDGVPSEISIVVSPSSLSPLSMPCNCARVKMQMTS